MSIDIRQEQPTDRQAIRQVVQAAFAAKSHLNHQETRIIDQLRASGDLTVSLVAVAQNPQQRRIVGYIAASPVTITTPTGDLVSDWYGVGPLAVLPEFQRRGIGGRLVITVKEEMRGLGGRGCVVLGRPEFYGRFGFEGDEGLRFPGAPKRVFMRVMLLEEEEGRSERLEGVVKYAEGWEV